MTPDEKDVVRRYAHHLADPLPPDADDMDLFWRNYGEEQIGQDFPWEDWSRATYLQDVAYRYARVFLTGRGALS